MHRKFIALILSTALVIAGFSAAPARANPDTGRLFAGFVALALIGAAIQSSRRDRHTVSTSPYLPPSPVLSAPIPAKPTPHKIVRRNLPNQCLRTHSVNGRQRNLFGGRCLKNNYAFNGTLPYACRLGFWDGRRNRIGYEPRCLRENGYRFARR